MITTKLRLCGKIDRISAKSLYCSFTRTIKEHHTLLFVECLFLFVGVFLAILTRYQINPDGISYIEIAKNIENGNFKEAVNGYWSPLFPVLLTPLLAFNIDALLATKILSLLIGMICIGILYRYWEFLDLGNFTYSIFFLPIIVYMAFSVITPDFLSATLLLIFLNSLMETKKTSAIWGWLCYLAKAYNLYIVFAFLGGKVVYLLLRKKQDKRIRISIFSLTSYLLLCFIWIIPLSLKYNSFTMQTTGDYSHWLAREAEIQKVTLNTVQRHRISGLIEPVYENSTAGWYDPSYYPQQKWNPLSSRSEFVIQWNIFKKNVSNLFDQIIPAEISMLAMGIIAVSILIVITDHKQKLRSSIASILLFTLLYPGLYLLISIQLRFLFSIVITIYLLGYFFIRQAIRNFSQTATRQIIAAIIIFIYSLTFLFPHHSFFTNLLENNSNEIQYQSAKKLCAYIPAGTSIASNSNWAQTLYTAYFLDAKYYGITKERELVNLYEELNKYRIQYYIYYDDGQKEIYRYPGFRYIHTQGDFTIFQIESAENT